MSGHLVAVDGVHRESLGPDRTERRVEQAAGVTPILLGASAGDDVDSGAGE